ncbi:alpha-ketoglutarate-dependent dioxygenase AlkB family protein [Oceanicoccus sagamiensis]|uniref:Alpha-ketoglutarate-dependent dioxygenase AlkB n=1 Tax=Oceanicoccus sagamiensis TaxID=716816 RepID=A0A1X9NE47_9GAMM|nr:alpha-ketoglutarate-dependent dioxygenase AlkB [Oceanicoccus sagamiensis]ARN75836.1 alpha-ketoglutarate-dependent dioxygenase AlkB [Oceanicoccus sagamiensis]
MQAGLFSSTPQVFDLPQADISYYEDFIADEAQVYQQLLADLQWHQDTIQMYGKPVLIPRMNAWYGDKEAAYSYSGLKLTPIPWTESLLLLKQTVEQQLNRRFNSVLANYYRDGADSVAWHSDDEAELGLNPVIASLSFGATRRFSLRRKKQQQAPIHIDLHGGSLLVMAGQTQQYWHHQIAKTTKPVAGRINLTFRSIQL